METSVITRVLFSPAGKLHEMATWSDVELLTNEDTNTVRWSSVSKEEPGSGLYQVDTLVKITANEVRKHLFTDRRWTLDVFFCDSRPFPNQNERSPDAAKS